MSNHDGSHILNEVLLLLEEYEFFKMLNKKDTVEFIEKVAEIGMGHDCNNGEILDEIGQRIGICYYCLKYAKEFADGVCLECNT